MAVHVNGSLVSRTARRSGHPYAAAAPDRASALPAGNLAKSLRLSLARRTPRGPIDGGWWPRSADASVEIAPLLRAVGDAYSSDVTDVIYDRTHWLPTSHRLSYNGSPLKIGRYEVADPHLITLVLRNGTRVLLLVVPPHFAPDQAAWAMHRACEPRNTLRPYEILRQAPIGVLEQEIKRELQRERVGVSA
jgi:hypothetical protein